jgi:hypothetical protein
MATTANTTIEKKLRKIEIAIKASKKGEVFGESKEELKNKIYNIWFHYVEKGESVDSDHPGKEKSSRWPLASDSLVRQNFASKN